MPIKPAVRATALLTPEATPACSTGTEFITVVVNGATKISVRDIGNGKTYDAVVKGYDATHDIAVLQLVGASGLATATVGDSSKVAAGAGGAGGAGGACANALPASPHTNPSANV